MPGKLMIIVRGDRGVGKSTKAAELAKDYPNAVVVDEHGFGVCRTDAQIGRRRFRHVSELGVDWAWGLETAIVVGDAEHHKHVIPARTQFLEIRYVDVLTPV